MCSFAPQTPSEKRAQSALSSLSRSPVESMRCNRLADLTSQAAAGLRDQISEQRAECLARALGIGVGEGRARYRPSSEVVEPVRMAGEAGFDLAQALRARQLPVQKGDELVAGGQCAESRTNRLDSTRCA